MNAAEFAQLIQTLGPAGIMALWLWSERKERLRLQRMVESFLPLIEGTSRAIRSVKRVVAPLEESEDESA